MNQMKIGIIGAGVISQQYLDNLTKAKSVTVEMVADIDQSRAEQRAQEYTIPSSCNVEQLLGRTDIELVVNLTIPKAHEEVTSNCLRAGKHVWSEKPLAMDFDAVQRIQKLATETKLHVGCAPDTFLGPGIQTGLRLIQQGRIGKVLSATTAFEVPGPESWHPNPDFLYAKGGGPIFDMGPYYLTALVCALGPIGKVSARANKSRESRVIGSGPRAGETFPVEVPTNVVALLDFRSGNFAQSSFSFDSAKIRAGVVEIHGTEGTLVLPDPNGFEGSLQLFRHENLEGTAEEIPCEGKVMYRGVGVVDMIRAVRDGDQPRANLDLAGHVVEVMQALETSGTQSREIEIQSTPTKPALVSQDFDPWAEI